MKTQLSMNGSAFTVSQINDHIAEAISFNKKTNGGTYYSQALDMSEWYTSKQTDVAFEESIIPNNTVMDITSGSFAYLSTYQGTGSVTVHHYNPIKGWIYQGISTHGQPHLSDFTIELVNELMVVLSAYNANTSMRSTLVFVCIEKAFSLDELTYQRFTYVDIGYNISDRCQVSYNAINNKLYLGVGSGEYFDIVSLDVLPNISGVETANTTLTTIITGVYGFGKSEALHLKNTTPYITLDTVQNKLKIITINSDGTTNDKTYPYRLTDISSTDMTTADNLVYSSESNDCMIVCISKKVTRSAFVVFFYDKVLNDYYVREIDTNSFVEYVFTDNYMQLTMFGLNSIGDHAIIRGGIDLVTKKVSFLNDNGELNAIDVPMVDILARKIVAYNRNNNSCTFIESRDRLRITNYLVIDRTVEVIQTRHAIDFEFEYKDIEGIPLSTVTAIDGMVSNSHTHNNHNVLNKLNRGTVDNLTYNSQHIKVTPVTTTW